MVADVKTDYARDSRDSSTGATDSTDIAEEWYSQGQSSTERDGIGGAAGVAGEAVVAVGEPR